MGSGGSRKANDVVIINRPIAREGGVGASAGGKARAQDANDVCPQAFEIRIKPRTRKRLPDGVRVIVNGDMLMVLGQQVGTLTPERLRQMEECAGMGIRYSGQVVNKDNDRVYAHFEQP